MIFGRGWKTRLLEFQAAKTRHQGEIGSGVGRTDAARNQVVGASKATGVALGEKQRVPGPPSLQCILVSDDYHRIPLLHTKGSTMEECRRQRVPKVRGQGGSLDAFNEFMQAARFRVAPASRRMRIDRRYEGDENNQGGEGTIPQFEGRSTGGAGKYRGAGTDQGADILPWNQHSQAS